jgi:hypothetical protein
MSDLSSSLKEIFNERISSPFYGSLIVSWLLWNWKIPYVTFFIDQNRLGDCTNKIDYIFTHCSNPWNLTLFPLLSTALILFVLPYATNYAFYVTTKFDRLRKDKQIEINTLKLQLETALKMKNEKSKQPVSENIDTNDLTLFLNNSQVTENYEKIVQRIQLGNKMDNIPNEAVQFCLAFDLIKNLGIGLYSITDKGNHYLREFITRKRN